MQSLIITSRGHEPEDDWTELQRSSETLKNEIDLATERANEYKLHGLPSAADVVANMADLEATPDLSRGDNVLR